MLDRLVGLENEYAIRTSTSAPTSGAAPGNEAVYHELVRQISSLHRVLPGRGLINRKRIFVENGGSYCYESLAWAPDDGLIEGDTPECRGPGQLLLYQRTQEAQLLQAAQAAGPALSSWRQPVEVSLLRNCRDAQGNVYGAQENYEVELAQGASLWAYRLGLVALMGPLALVSLVSWCFLLLILLSLLVLMLVAIAAMVVAAVVPALEGIWLLRLFEEEDRTLERWLGRLGYGFTMAISWPVLVPFAALVWAFGFRRIRRGAMAFLISRPVWSGAGTLRQGRRFGLSEKGPSICRVLRWSVAPKARPIFDIGNLMKGITGPMDFRFSGVRPLFARRQRLQLGLADANRCQVAEYLKLGATILVLDMAEAGWLDDAPHPADPLAALHRIIEDPSLQVEIELEGGRAPMTALALQRWYLEQARAFVREHPAPSIEAPDVLRLWGEALDALEEDPGALVGRIDWVTKRYLMEAAGGPEAEDAVLKKIDLRYHELGPGGYLSKLEEACVAPRLVSQEEIERALGEPPHGSPAVQRGRLIRQLADAQIDATVSGRDVVVGRWRSRDRKVIRLDDFRDP